MKKNKYDYLVIYGCHIKRVLNKRLEHSLKVINDNNINKIVLTGGIGLFGNYNESEYMKECLLNKGINKDKLLLEGKSKTTRQNNINVMNMLKLSNTKSNISILLISQRNHLRRIKRIWNKILKNDNITFYYEEVI